MKKKINKYPLDRIKERTKIFCTETSLHGYKYVFQPELPKLERNTWTAIVFCLLCLSLIGMYEAWNYNSSHSNLTVIESIHHGVWNFPFPAVTVCNVNQISLKKARKFIEELKLLRGLPADYVLKEMRLLSEMIDPGIFEYDISLNLTVLQNVFDVNHYTAAQVMKLVKQDCSVLLQDCRWRGIDKPCEKLFQEIYMRHGICCSFNYFDKQRESHRIREPLKVNACGYQTALSFKINPEPDDYHVSSYSSFGVKAMTHYPYNFPGNNDEFKVIGLGVQSFTGVEPDEVYSTSSFRSIPLRDRKCAFDDEDLPESLKLLMEKFPTTRYTYANCLNSCRLAVIVEECGCAPFYVPQNESRVCNLRDLTCLKKIRHIYDVSWPGSEINNADIPDVKIDYLKMPCGCLPDCNLYTYSLESSFDFLTEINYGDRFPKVNKDYKNYSIVHVFYKDLVARRYRRDVNFTWKSIFASFGGLLALLIGFSTTAIFELVYFFLLRPIFDDSMKHKPFQIKIDFTQIKFKKGVLN